MTAFPAIYVVAFTSALNQFPALLGERGLLPVTRFVAAVPFRVAPSIWFLRFVEKLLEHDRPTLNLLRSTPFPSAPPARIRAGFYRYEFTTPAERRATGAWWKREWIGEFLPPGALHDLRQP